MSNSMSSAAENIAEHKQDLAQLTTDLYFDDHAELEDQYGKKGREKCLEDTIYHINYLEQAVRVNSVILFSNYLEWARTMLKERDIPVNDLVDNMMFLKKALQKRLAEDEAAIVVEFITKGLQSFNDIQIAQETFLKDGNPLVEEARIYLELLLAGNRKEAAKLIDDLVAHDTPIKDIYEYIFQNTQYEVGVLWQNNKISVAHEHYCTAATQLIMSRLYPKIFSMDKKKSKLVACSVADELHEIGIRMVADFFEMDGWDTHYLGANMPDEHLIKTLKEFNADILAISVTLPLHIGQAQDLIQKLKRDKEAEDIKVLVGGYPFRFIPDLWKKLGADASASTAKEAIEIANKLIRN
ncbi:Methanogenic corrinoid protein MtbC1 [Fodinibius roseus]|uniref:Methanogenic corrinoid protein MtbC1 n=2 Tax=Fodinibius roseus TaxID=1194090 RepID=A0A1M5HYT4_9BACT|nr:Methanogenic corrinoid protein MtbC1 [Fodinibius roseus]